MDIIIPEIKPESELINLSASARLIFQLGEQLISDEFVALMELIKNSYDADATQVKVDVDTNIETEYGVGKITVEDNGNGMIYSTIKHGFLRLSTNFKKEFRLSPYYKRRVLGDKGLGRLSIQRLGRYIDVTTTPRIERLDEFFKEEDKEYLAKYNQFLITLDWNKLNMDVDLNNIVAEVFPLSIDIPKYGNKIEILGIRNQNFWDFSGKDEKRLKNEIFSMVNPFIKNKKTKFQVYLNINGKPYTNENINEDIIEKMSDYNVTFSFQNWKFKIVIERKYKYAKREINDMITRMKEHEFKLFSEDESNNLCKEDHYILDFRGMDSIKVQYPFLKTLELDTIDKEMAYPGDFSGSIYASEFSRENQSELIKLIQAQEFTKDIKTYGELKSVWEAAKGIYIFRNDFRILPYGKLDWIGFTNKSQTFKNNIYKQHSVAGYINIDGLTSENLVEQTNRQGIVEDEYGNNFLRIIKEVLLEIIVRNDVKFREGFQIQKRTISNEYIETKNKILKFRKEVSEKEKKDDLFKAVTSTANIVISQSNHTPEDELRTVLHEYLNNGNGIEKVLTAPDKTINAMLNVINDSAIKEKEVHSNLISLRNQLNEIKDLDVNIANKHKQEQYMKDKEIEELHGLLPLIGQGIIVESLTHELNRIDENIKSYASRTKLELSGKKTYDIDQLVKNQQLIIDETIYLRDQLNHLEPTYRKNNNLFEIIDAKKFVNETYLERGPMSRKAKDKGISVNVVGGSFLVEANKGYFITVFDNLFLNSLYWVSENEKEKNINFELFEDGRIIFWDSGPGIHEEIEKDLFDPFKSMKKEGRGLGLFIAKELLNNMNAEIFLLNERRNNRLYKFEIRFTSFLEVNYDK